MPDRDEFSAEVKRALAERAGHRCSFPSCPVVTIGPSNEGEKSVSKTGMACHIAAASSGPGARRYVSTMSKEERTAIKNGIWMCYDHGKMIDTDDQRFTIPMLEKWREFAESRAKFRQELGADKPLPQNKLVEIGFADQALSFSSLGNETKVIGQALLDSCVPLVWGAELCNAVRDVLVEIVRNTFTHGSASTCLIIIRKRAIHVTDNGSDFNWLGLSARKDGRGGAAAVKELFGGFGDKLVLGVKRVGEKNETTIAIAHSMEDIALVSPCSIQVTDEELEDIRSGVVLDTWFPPETSQCNVVYMVLPQFAPHSDAILLADSIKPETIKDRQLVFVTSNASSGVRGYLLRRFPTARVLNIRDS